MFLLPPAPFFLASRWQAGNKLDLDFAEGLRGGAREWKQIPVVMRKEPQHLGHRALHYLGGFLVPSFPSSPSHFWLVLVNADLNLVLLQYSVDELLK